MSIIEKLQNKIDNTPWRCDDQDLQVLICYTQDILDNYQDLQKKYMQTLENNNQNHKAMVGNVLGLMLNKPELLAKE